MKERLPINVEILKWARESLGLSCEEVAYKISKSFKPERIRAWEAGIGSPTYPQLEKLAYEIYKRPVALFFFPSVPEEDTPESEFRTLPGVIAGQLPVEMIKMYREAKTLQLFLEELYEGDKPVEKSLIDLFTVDLKKNQSSDALNTFNPERITKEIREFLEISIDEQCGWTSTETAFKKWRDALEERGIFVFKDAFNNDNYSGFCLYDDKYPLIYVNNSMPFSRQIFTLFHELAHLLLHKGGIDFRSREIVEGLSGEYKDLEVFCNRFAGEFLVPFETFTPDKDAISEERISELAERYSVSREVILRRYFDLGLVDRDYYEEMSAKWIEQCKDKKGSGGNYYYNKRAYLGERYINLAFSRYYRNRITVEALAEYLGVKVMNLSTFEYKVME